MSQVKNLRAMFENKGDDPSPPDRGRSPSGAGSASRSSDSPRPLSSVRSSFVAIEKDGRMGLRREPSHESSPSRRPLSSEHAPEGSEQEAMSPTPLQETGKTSQRLFGTTSIPEASNESASTPVEPVVPSELSQAHSSSPKYDSKEVVEIEQPLATVDTSGDTGKCAEASSKPASKALTSSKAGERTQTAQASSTIGKQQSAAKSQATRPIKTTPKPSSAVPSDTSRATGSSKRAEPKSSQAGSQAGTSSPRPKQSAPAATKRPVPIKTVPEHNNGFVKPKPKSPTKPVSLPASLMAPTASSVSKVGGARTTAGRQPGAGQAQSSAHRASSRASASTDTSTARSNRRQPPLVTQSRSSIGPPPKKNAQPSSAPKREAHVDEGFLARMMRPTQASSSKTHEKAPVTPPTRRGARASTGSSSRQESSARKQSRASGTSDRRPQTPDVTETISATSEDGAAAAEAENSTQDVARLALADQQDEAQSQEDDAVSAEDAGIESSSEPHSFTNTAPGKQDLADRRDELPAAPTLVSNDSPSTSAVESSEPARETQDALANNDVQELKNTEADLAESAIPAEPQAQEIQNPGADDVAESPAAAEDSVLEQSNAAGHSPALAPETALAEQEQPEPLKIPELSSNAAVEPLSTLETETLDDTDDVVQDSREAGSPDAVLEDTLREGIPSSEDKSSAEKSDVLNT